MVNKYQVFISATFEDLKEERKKVQDTILSMSQFPAGMEMFNASNEEPWEIVRQAIDNSDFYVLIIGHKYGSVIEDGKYAGISFTQREYYYALEKEIPVFAFLIDSNAPVTQDKVEQETVKKEKLEAFKKEIMTRHHVVSWMNKYDLASKVSIALSHKFKNELERMTEKKNESEKKETKLDQKEVDENKQEPQREIESRHRMECQMNKDDLATEVSVELSKEINKGKKPECIGEQCLEKDEPERKIISLGQQGKEVSENKQELQKEAIDSDNKNKLLSVIKLKEIHKALLSIGVIAIILFSSLGLFLINRDKEKIQANETMEMHEDNIQKDKNIELSKDNAQEDKNTELYEDNTQENEDTELYEDNAQEDKNEEEIQSLEVNDKIIDWEWGYEENTDNMRRFLINIPSELGITVSYYQGDVDWEKVRADGVDFAIIRVGSRGYEGGKLRLDSKFKENMDGAIANDIKAGVYFFSQAINQEEMEEEINVILKAIEGYSLGYPVGIELDCIEKYRTYELSKPEHQKEYIDLIKYFCTRIKQNGYAPMIVGQLDWFQQFPDGTFDEYYKWVYSDDSAPNNIDNCVIWTYYENSLGVIDGIDAHVSVGLGVYDGQID